MKSTLSFIRNHKDEIIGLMAVVLIYSSVIGTIGFRLYEYFSGPTILIEDTPQKIYYVHRWAAIFGTGENKRVALNFIGGNTFARISTKNPPNNIYTNISNLAKNAVYALQRERLYNRNIYGIIINYRNHSITKLTVKNMSVFLNFMPYVEYIREEKTYVYKFYVELLSYPETWSNIKEALFGDIQVTTSRFKEPDNVYVMAFLYYNGKLVGTDITVPFWMLRVRDNVYPENIIVISGQSVVINSSIFEVLFREYAPQRYFIDIETCKNYYSGVIVFDENGNPVSIYVQRFITHYRALQKGIYDKMSLAAMNLLRLDKTKVLIETFRYTSAIPKERPYVMD